MRLSPDGKVVRTDIWREGKYLDLWSIPHFLSGFSLGLAMHFTGFAVAPSFIIGFLLLVGYEMFEAIAKIEETPQNRTLDVAVGMASFAPALLFAPRFPARDILLILASALAADGVLSWFGWKASQKAAAFEEKVRSEIEAQRLRFHMRRLRRMARRRELLEGRNALPR